MSAPPESDVLERGRVQRLLIAAVVGGAVLAGIGLMAAAFFQPRDQPDLRGWIIVVGFAATSGVVAFVMTNLALRMRAVRREWDQPIAKARVVRSRPKRR